MTGVQEVSETVMSNPETTSKVSAESAPQVDASLNSASADSAPAAAEGGDSATGSAGESAASEADAKKANNKFPQVRLAPAPVPTSSPWKATAREAKPVPLPVALDSSRKESKKDTSPKDRPKKNTGKEKWMPYTPVVTTTPPSGSGGQPKPKQKSRAKQASGRKHGNNHHNSGNGSTGSHNNAGSANGSATTGSAGSQSPANGAEASQQGQQPSQSIAKNSGASTGNAANLANSTGSAHHSSGQQHHHRAHNQGNSHSNSSYRRANQNKKDNDQSQKHVFQQVPVAASPYDIALGMLVQQMEYYFSIENLCKDIYLRRQMNGKGLVSIAVLANFNRVRSLSGGDLNLVIEACRWAPSAEIIGEKVRLRKDWAQWVLPPDERLEAGLSTSSDEDDDTPKFQVESAVPFIPKAR